MGSQSADHRAALKATDSANAISLLLEQPTGYLENIIGANMHVSACDVSCSIADGLVRNWRRWQLWLNYFLIVFGMVGAVVGVADSAYRLLHGDV